MPVAVDKEVFVVKNDSKDAPKATLSTGAALTLKTTGETSKTLTFEYSGAELAKGTYTIKIENITEFNPRYKTANLGAGLPVLIEYGHGGKHYYYDYPFSDEFCDPRPFVANTRKRLKKSGKHKEALKNGLIRNHVKSK